MRWNDAGNGREQYFRNCDITEKFGTYLQDLRL